MLAASLEKACIVTRADVIDLTDTRTEALLALSTLLAGEGFGSHWLFGEPPSEGLDDVEASPVPGVLELTLDVVELAPDEAEPPFGAAVAATLEASCVAGAESEPYDESRRQEQAAFAAKAEFFIEALSKWVSHFIQSVVSYFIVHRAPPPARTPGSPC